MKRAFIYFGFVLFLLLLVALSADAQYKVKGTVYDSSYMKPLIAVTIQATNGKMVSTNDKGQYVIEVGEKDSIWFSYFGKPTVKYPVMKIYDVTRFDIALQTYNQVMEEVVIWKRSYKEDSVRNRMDYARIFNYRKPNFESMTSIGPMGAGIDVQELIRLFQFKKNKATLKFQERLLQQERDKFIDHKFNKGLIKSLTGLEGEELDRYVQLYRPSFEMILSLSEYEFREYIVKSAEEFKNTKAF